MGFGEQPLASIVRIADLCARIEALTEESPLLLAHVIELARLMFEDDLPYALVGGRDPGNAHGDNHAVPECRGRR